MNKVPTPIPLKKQTLDELYDLRGAILGSGYPWRFVKDELTAVQDEIDRRTLFKTDKEIMESDRKIREERKEGAKT